MVIDFGVKNRVVRCEITASKASDQHARNGPSTQLIEATCCIERSDAMIGAEDLSYFLAIKREQRTKLVKLLITRDA
jgi:hypothetical protein